MMWRVVPFAAALVAASQLAGPQGVKGPVGPPGDPGTRQQLPAAVFAVSSSSPPVVTLQPLALTSLTLQHAQLPIATRTMTYVPELSMGYSYQGGYFDSAPLMCEPDEILLGGSCSGGSGLDDRVYISGPLRDTSNFTNTDDPPKGWTCKVMNAAGTNRVTAFVTITCLKQPQ